MSKSKFLHLPDLVLEEIFSLLETKKQREKSLISLTECSKFLKNYIATNPKLMKRLTLSAAMNCDGILTKKDQEILETCLDSHRKYKSIILTIRPDRVHFEDDESDDPKMKMLFEKHATTIKEAKFIFKTWQIRKEFVLEVLQNLEVLMNVEEITIRFKLVDLIEEDYERLGLVPEMFRKNIRVYHGRSCRIDSQNYCLCRDVWSDYEPIFGSPLSVPEKISFANQFEHLKKLSLTTESAIVFHVFENCKKLEILELKFGITHMYLTKLYSMIRNSRETLKTLKISSDYNLPINMRNIEDLFAEMTKAEVDLKSLQLNLPFLRFLRIELLIEFLRSQKNLENFEYRAIISEALLDSVGGILQDLMNLKTLKFDLDMDDFSYPDPRVRKVWNLENLEELSIRCWAKSGYEIPHKFFYLPSQTMKKIVLAGNIKWWIERNIYKNITENFQNLVELKFSSNFEYKHSSNDIFLILKQLKKLKVLKFVFPPSSQLDISLFETDDNLCLPEIEDVEFWFNKSINDLIVFKFLQFINKVSKFCFNAWPAYKEEFLEIIVRELHNLSDLEFPRCLSGNIKSDVWEELKKNVHKFSKRRDSFRVDGEKIDYWMKTQRTFKYGKNNFFESNMM